MPAPRRPPHRPPVPTSHVPSLAPQCHYLSVINRDLRTHMNLPIRLQGQNRSAATTAMLDSGASTTFINSAFVQKHNVTTRRLPNPIPLHNADGSQNAIGLITHEAHLRMQTGDHEEKIIASVANTGADDIILGIDWLRHHNPEIDWEKGTLDFT